MLKLPIYSTENWGECDALLGKYGQGELGVCKDQTTTVGFFEVANDFGLYDMHGNVSEWCADILHENYQDAPTDEDCWIDNDQIIEHELYIQRGGSIYDSPFSCRSAARFGRLQKSYPRENDLCGFRVVYSQNI